MLTLFILRHAKSEKHADTGDMERPLNKRGMHDAPVMGKRLAALRKRPKRIVSSPAKRAVQTARRVAKELHFEPKKIEKEPRLYLAEAVEILRFVQSCDDKAARILLVGHNPGFTDFVNWMVGQPVTDNLPTAGIVQIDFDAEHWGDLRPGTGKVMHVDYPKNPEP